MWKAKPSLKYFVYVKLADCFHKTTLIIVTTVTHGTFLYLNLSLPFRSHAHFLQVNKTNR